MNEPINFAAAKAARTNNAADWTPRDCLLDLLAKMDEGAVEPEGLILCFYETGENGGAVVKYSSAMPNVIMAAGTLDRALHALSPPATQL
jgi:hypothetical protein